MIAQKLKNNKIAISSGKPRKDAIETIEDLRVGEFFRLSRASRNWDKSLNDRRDIMFTTYENEHSKVCKEFDAMYQRRQSWIEYQNKKVEEEESLNFEQTNNLKEENQIANETEAISLARDEKPKIKNYYKSNVIGTSRLIKIKSKETIKIVRRKGPKDSTNRPNSVCINNKLREDFFSDCKKTSTFHKDNKTYEIINTKEDNPIYEKWDSIIKNVFQEGFSKNENN